MSSKKDMLLEKAKNRTITQEESIELRSILEQEARNAQAVGDFVKFLARARHSEIAAKMPKMP
jgi:hypothetical protein